MKNASKRNAPKNMQKVRELERQRIELKREFTRRTMKAFCVALNQEFGFGKSRIIRLILKVVEISKEREHDEVFWSHIDIYCKHLGLDFPDENYDRMDG